MKTKHFLMGVAVATNFSVSFGQWAPVGAGFNREVNALTFFDDTLYAGSEFDSSGAAPASHIAKLSGSTWVEVGNIPNSVYTLMPYASRLYAGCDFSPNFPGLISLENGTTNASWQPVGGGTNGKVLCLTWHQGALYVGGTFTKAGNLSANFIAKWNGTNWSSCGVGTNGPVYAMAVYNNELYAGGAFDSAGAKSAKYIAKWDGNTWSPVGNGLPSVVSSLADYYQKNELVAGGFFPNHISKWNGTSWQTVGSGTNGSVLCFYTWIDDLILGGGFTTANSQPMQRVAKWNGSNFYEIGFGMNGNVKVFAQKDDILYAGGNFTEAGGNGANRVAKLILGNDLATPTITNESGATIYPNPFETEAKILIALPRHDFQMIIYNALGEEIRKLNFNDNQTVIRRENLQPGVYFYKIVGQDLNTTGKFVVE